jgi:hypothetical protein
LALVQAQLPLAPLRDSDGSALENLNGLRRISMLAALIVTDSAERISASATIGEICGFCSAEIYAISNQIARL